MNRLKFELSNDDGRTLVEQEWDYDPLTLDSLIEKIRNCIIACGFSEEIVDVYIK